MTPRWAEKKKAQFFDESRERARPIEGAEERLRGRWQEAAAGRTPTWCTVYHAYVVCMHDILLASSTNTLASI